MYSVETPLSGYNRPKGISADRTQQRAKQTVIQTKQLFFHIHIILCTLYRVYSTFDTPLYSLVLYRVYKSSDHRKENDTIIAFTILDAKLALRKTPATAAAAAEAVYKDG